MNDRTHTHAEPTTVNAEQGQPACPACHGLVEAADRFCGGCGAQLESPEDAPSPADAISQEAPPPQASGRPATLAEDGNGSAEPLRCACGEPLPAHAAFCLRCGHPLAGDVSTGYTLRCVRGGAPSETPIPETGLKLGQNRDCDLVVGDDPYVSREHARLRVQDGGVWVEDLTSSNGTFVRVERPLALEAGDELVIGKTRLRLERTDG